MGKRILLITIFSFLLLQAKAQLSYDLMQFSADLEKYVDGLGNKDASEAMGDFLSYYNAGKLTNAQKMSVIKLCNQLVNVNIGAPAFADYLAAMNGILEKNQVPKFDGWHKVLNTTLASSKDDFKRFAKVSRHIFADQVVAEHGAMRWFSSNADISLQTKGEPAFIIKNTDLFCYTPGDTLEIYQTSGTYFPAQNKWVGAGGKLDWTRVGIDSANMYADLIRYSIDFASGLVSGDTALFYYPALFSKPIKGKVLDKPMAQSLGEKSVYPQFSSFEAVLKDYPFGRSKFTGGFGMKGRVIIGTSVDSVKAQMVFTYKDRPTLKVKAREIIVRGERVNTQKAEAIIYIDKDSIYHPQIEFTYRLKDHFVSLYSASQGISQAPFFDTYHNIEFYCDEIRWPLDNPKIEIDMINDNQPAKFESFNYFRDSRYEKVQGILDYNPLVRIKQYTEKNKIKGFYIADYAAFFKSNKSDIKIQMIELNDKGYVSYDSDKEYVTVRRKLQDYVNAHAGRTDFDAIGFFSIIKRYPNATLSLINNDLAIQGVPKFFFSDSQNVYIIPQDQQITMKKNRNMDFAGKLHAGKVDFYGKGFSFDYTTFQVRLSNVDSMKFYYKDGTTGEELPIRSALQNIYGTLEIDHPLNKSGRKKIPGYPIFTSDAGANITYDKPSTYNGVYNRNRFYFKVDPFKIDSLNELNFESLALAGTLYAGGIVPDFRADIKLQPDKSLGFQLPELPYPLYGGKGTSNLKLALSDEGFFGDGDFTYLTSTSRSGKFELFLDSLNSYCNVFENKRNAIFPTVDATNTYEHWLPFSDSLFVSNTKDGMAVSDARSVFNGTLVLTPTQLKGSGEVDVDQAKLISREFKFKPDDVYTDRAIFKLKNYPDSSKFAFTSADVKGNLDLQNRRAEYSFLTTGINSEFMFNLYAGSFEQFKWMIDEKTIDFAPTNLAEAMPNTYLLSMRTSQDSLTFKTGLTRLDVTDYTLYAQKIPFIAVGDAHIFPDSAKVVIRSEAKMDQLENAKITADTIQKYHYIENATLRIGGRFLLQGTGNYEYTDKSKNKQKFLLNEIVVDSERHLLGKTDIPESINFFAGTKIQFKGRVFLKSILKNLEYDGFFLPQHNLPYPRTDWFRNTAVINPDSVFINVQPVLTNQNKQALTNGFYISNDSMHVYSAFFTRKRNGSDPELMKVEGVLFFDEKAMEFKMGDYGKLFKENLKGNIIKVNERKQTAEGEGRFKFGYETGKFEFVTGGTAAFNAADTTFTMHLAGLLNFPIPTSALKLMYDSLNNQSVEATAPEFKADFMKKALAEIVEERAVRKVTEDIEDNSLKLVSDLQKTIFFTDLNLKWNQATRTLQSSGDMGINSFEKYRLERKVGGRMELKRGRTGDDFTLYLTGAKGSWYFIRYQKNILYLLASDPLFNQYIKDNMDKLSKDEFKMRQANIAERNRFVKNMKK